MTSVEKKRGYVVLMSLLVLAAIGSLLVVSSILFGVLETKNTILEEQATKARYFTDSCVEHALYLVWQDTSFSGSGSLAVSDGSCTYSVSNTGASTKNIEATGTFQSVTQRKEVNIDFSTNYILSESWTSVSDF